MKRKKVSKRIRVIACLTFVLLLTIWTIWGNVTVGVTHYTVVSNNLPQDFDHYKIAVVSDLHNASFGSCNDTIIEKIRNENPDIIAVTGDLVDANRTDIDIAIDLIEDLVQIAPCYYVTGNHEAWIGPQYPELEKQLLAQGVIVLHDSVDTLKKGDSSIQIDELALDASRTAEIYQNADKYLDNIDAEFERATGLSKTDISFLLLATALQIGRWVVIGEINGAVSKQIGESRVAHDDQSIKDMEKEKRYNYKEKHKDDPHTKSRHRDWANIVFDSVPYDITRGSAGFGVNMEAGYHRIHTLGHDPVLGWIFGTMNILSDTITLDKTYGLRTYKVEMMEKPKRWTGIYTGVQAFADAIDSIKEDENRLPAAVFAQAIHLKSDEFTKLGLPVPLLEAFHPDLASKLYKEGYDSLCLMKDIAVS